VPALKTITMRPPIHLFFLALSFIPSTIAVFADGAYQIDYHYQLLGLPQQHATFFHRPRKDEKASLLYTLSDQGVVGAINPGSGAIVWRQFLALRANVTLGGSNGVQGYLRAAEGEPTVVSALGEYVYAWDAVSGREQWYNQFGGLARDLEVMETAGDEAQKDVLVLFEEAGKGVLRRLRGANGNVVWEHVMESADVPFQVSTNVRHVFVVSLYGARGGYNLRVTTLDPVTGKKLDEHTLASKADVHKAEDILFVGANTAAPIVVWTDGARKTLKVNVLGTKQVHSLVSSTTGEEVEKIIVHAPHLIQSQPHFLVHSQSSDSHWADIYHVDIVAGTVSEAYRLPKLAGKGAFSTSSQEGSVYFTRHSEDEVTIFSSVSHGVLSRYPIKAGKDFGSVVHGVSEVVSKSASSYVVRSAVVSTEENWDMIRNGIPAWRREEGITGVVAAAWAEIPEGEDLAKTLEAEAHSNPFSAYIHRVNRHLSDLQYLPEYLQNIPKRLLSSIAPKDTSSEGAPLVRDNFGFHKLVILATERGRLYALVTGNQGKIIWSLKAFDMAVGEKWDVKGIFADNTNGVATIRGSEGEHITVKIDTGAVIETMWRGSSPPVQSTALVEGPSRRWLLPIGPGGKFGPVPKAWAPKNGLVVRGEGGEVKGITFRVQDRQATPTETWSFQPPPGERILSVTSRPAHDPVASIGRVLSDRSVLYKYLNPNTILVTSASDAESSISFYLLDSVSGDILYSTVHESVDITKPIASVLTENWFAYSFWSDIPTDSALPFSKGYQLVISELYESSIPNDRGLLGTATNFSSLLPSTNPFDEPSFPYVATQAFVIPEAISHMVVSQTRQGITSRLLLCALPASNAIVGVPRTILDPRRPVGRDPTPGEIEEGLMRYNPNIEFDPKMLITHKREVLGVRNTITAPALLESTSLVFAYGIDIFGTRVTPSMAFDILGKDFNRLALVGTVSGLAALVRVLAPIVSAYFTSLLVNPCVTLLLGLLLTLFRYGKGRSMRNGTRDEFIDLVLCSNRYQFNCTIDKHGRPKSSASRDEFPSTLSTTFLVLLIHHMGSDVADEREREF
jgi:ER membrane protein complex subunit 1